MARAALGLLGARALALLAVASVALLPLVSSDDGYKHCEGVVRGWADSSTGREKDGDKLNLKDLLFFLHIPRTGGRTYFHCFLKKLYTNAQECPRSYDKLRFDPSHPDCKLVVTHDDYSLTSKLPRERTSVVTILRNPVDRVFSTYEFSVEVAARFLVHPNLTSAKLMTTRVLTKSRAVSTLDIWPWKYLVPWMREDLFARRDARVDKVHSSKKVNAYDVEDMVMPLHEYINDPVAHEIIHNGATFQITGLTNNSYFDGAHEVRHCVRQHPDLGHIVLEVAKNRLDQMLYVGLTEDHEESARLFAHMVGAQVLSQSGTLNLDLKEDLPSENAVEVANCGAVHDLLNIVTLENIRAGKQHVWEKNSTHGWQNNEALNSTSDEQGNRNMTVGKLMEAYETCIAKLRKSQSNRRKISLKKVAEANFSKEARKLVPEAILKQIISLNSLDMELYDHAKKIFTQEHLMLKAQQSVVVHHRQLAEQKNSLQPELPAAKPPGILPASESTTSSTISCTKLPNPLNSGHELYWPYAAVGHHVRSIISVPRVSTTGSRPGVVRAADDALQVLELAEGIVIASVSRCRAAAQAGPLSAGARPGPSGVFYCAVASMASRTLIEPSSAADAHAYRRELQNFSTAVSCCLGRRRRGCRWTGQVAGRSSGISPRIRYAWCAPIQRAVLGTRRRSGKPKSCMSMAVPMSWVTKSRPIGQLWPGFGRGATGLVRFLDSEPQVGTLGDTERATARARRSGSGDRRRRSACSRTHAGVQQASHRAALVPIPRAVCQR
ncbi:hypothetical protein C2845_PM09G03470 [Panicum miliaceum]|uniref:Protein-tyrosine sulfotransferase n=1 Tax=Panicum miliaceum TaxID=4540 RepID=A0A3L6S0L8_PANMI|nr:hypothetical protein C2845_PM09G03470 [Panicum miliaceum]